MKIDFVDKKVTPFGGFIVLKELLEQMNFEQAITQMEFPSQGSNRGYDPAQLIIGLMSSIWCGCNCFQQTEIFRHDRGLQELFGWKHMPGHEAYKRYFNKFNQSVNQRCLTNMYQWLFSNLVFDNYTLDLDSTVITRWGEQEGVAKGYNPRYKGRKSHHPLLAFIPDCTMVANCWLRPGNTADSSGAEGFLEDTFQKLKGKRVGLLRADSGFFSGKILDFLEDREKPISYIIACRFNSGIKRQIVYNQVWMQVDGTEGIDIAETTYKAEKWETARRIIIVRQDTTIREKAPGKYLKSTQGCLFPEEFELDKYRYTCYVTNLSLPSLQIWKLYRGRADSENRIKELKYDFTFDHFLLRDFWGTEAVMNIITMAYNIVSLLRHVSINSKKKSRLSTIRYEILAIPGYITKHANEKVLKLALALSRRKAFIGLMDNTRNLSSPIHYG